MTERHFAPDARYAAAETPGVRWYDERTGQERMVLPVTLERFVEAGATLSDLSGGRIVGKVAIGPYQPPEPDWQAEIVYEVLEARPDPEDFNIIATRTLVSTEVFDEREDAVSYAEKEVEAFATAERRPTEDRKR